MRKILVGLAAAAALLVLSVLRGQALAAEPGIARGDKVDVPGGYYTNVSPAVLQGMLARKDFLLINVHVPYEGEVAGTDLLIPFDEVERRRDLLPRNRSAKILLYCRSGAMSDTAARALVRRGYRNVWHLAGEMNAWKQAGLSLIYKGRK